MGAIIFIHIAKGLHHHHGDRRIEGRTSLIKAACTVCDYNFLKDADDRHFFAAFEQPLFFSDSHTYFHSGNPVTEVEAANLRGPPICL